MGSVIFRHGQVKKKKLNKRDLEVIGTQLKKKDSLHPYSKVRGVWHEDGGRRLFNYRRLHASIRRFFPGKNLKKKKIVHLGAGNGSYMHFLAKEYGVHPTSVDINRRLASRARRIGLNSNHIIADARKTRLPSSSQDAIISDHFLFSKFFSTANPKDIEVTRSILAESFRLLKPGGLLFIERATPNRSGSVFDNSVERPYISENFLEGFEVVEHVEGLHDYPDNLVRSQKSFGLTGLDLHPMMDLVVLRKPKEKRKLFNPLDIFKKE